MLFDIKTSFPEAQSSTSIPFDIQFAILEMAGEIDETVAHIHAHKYCLALASPVLKALLYGNWTKLPDVIEITNASRDSFQTMIDFIYGKKIDVIGKTYEQLRELKYLADWYQIPGLKKLISSGFTQNKPEFGIPDDIRFRVIEHEHEEELEYYGEDGQLIYAQKYRLALASKVFAAFLFGPLAFEDLHEIITIRGTTHDAFCTVIKYINNDPMGLEQKTCLELWNVLNQAEMYFLDGLKQMVTTLLKEFPLNDDNVVEVAQTADSYTQFEDIYKIIFNRCVVYLHSKMISNVTDMTELLHKYPTSSPKFLVAMKLIKMGPQDVCNSCHQYPCQHGKIAQDVSTYNIQIRCPGYKQEVKCTCSPIPVWNCR